MGLVINVYAEVFGIFLVVGCFASWKWWHHCKPLWLPMLLSVLCWRY